MIWHVFRYLVGSVGGAFLTLVLAAGVLAAVLALVDLRPLAVWAGRSATHRRVTLQTLHFSWDDGPVIDLSGFHLAGPSWGTAPDMIVIERARAVIDWQALLQGRMKFRKLETSGTSIYLERNAQGLGNWKFDGEKSHPAANENGGFAVIPANRTQFPTLLDAHLQNSVLRWRTSSGAILLLVANDLVIGAPDDDKPAHIVLDGSYNKAKARLTAVTDSFTVMRKADVPFGIRLRIATLHDRLDFAGTLMKPLDFDGVKGQLSIDAPSAEDILDIADVSRPVRLGSALAGTLTKNGDHWVLDPSIARIENSIFQGRMVLNEGGRGEPDALAFDLSSPQLALDPILKGFGAGSETTDWHKLPLAPDPRPGATIKARLRAGRVAYRAFSVENAALQFALLPRHWSLHEFSLRTAGGRLNLHGDLAGAGQDGVANASLAATGLQAAQLFRLAGLSPREIDGAISFNSDFSMRGRTLGDAVGASHGAAIVVVRDGLIDKGLTELASTDLHRLFRRPDQMVPLPCLVAGMTIENGVGRLAPLMVRTPDVALRGVGAVDLRQGTMNILIDSDRTISGTWALDLPFRVSGPFSAPHIGLAINENAGSVTRGANEAIPPTLAALGLEANCFPQ